MVPMAGPKPFQWKSVRKVFRWKWIRCKLFRSKAHQTSYDNMRESKVEAPEIEQSTLSQPSSISQAHLETDQSKEDQSSQYGLDWHRGEAVWTETPDIDAIKALVAHRVSSVLNTSVVESDIHVEFHGNSGYYKVYLISSPRLAKKYIFRTTLPVDPFYKTESEVATMAFIRKYTALPVPLVIDYCSSASNPIKFEWILQECAEGTPLSQTWDDMPFHIKADFTIQMQRHMQLLQAFDFPWIGNIYYSRCKDRVNGQPAKWLRVSDGQDQDDLDFVIGRIVSPWSFRGKRRNIMADRGPFVSGSQLMLAKADLQYEYLNLAPSPIGQELLNSQSRREVYQSIKAWAGTCPPREDEHRVLHHLDLSDRDIIVQSSKSNPIQLSGIINWESVGIVPTWEVDFPHFLKGPSDSELQSRWRPSMNASDSEAFMKDRQNADLRQIYGDPLRPALTGKIPQCLQGCAEILEQFDKAECCYDDEYVSSLCI